MSTTPSTTVASLQTGKYESLHSFQQRLSAKIQAAQTQASVELLRLHVRVQGRSLFFALPETSQILEPSKVTPIPLTQPWFTGLSNIRGELTGVVDLSLWLGWGATHATPFSRWVVLATSLGAPCAVVVDEVLGLANVSTASWLAKQPQDPDVDTHLPWLASAASTGVASRCWGQVHQQLRVLAPPAVGDSSPQDGAWACDFSLLKMSKLDAFTDAQQR
jgi:twitching motility protein PilI